jgi:hypothetical protein
MVWVFRVLGGVVALPWGFVSPNLKEVSSFLDSVARSRYSGHGALPTTGLFVPRNYVSVGVCVCGAPLPRRLAISRCPKPCRKFVAGTDFLGVLALLWAVARWFCLHYYNDAQAP